MNLITASNIISISEEYVTRLHDAEIFVNPNNSELLQIIKPQSVKPRNWAIGTGEIRFIADAKSKKVYVWDSGLLLHHTVMDKIGYDHKNSLNHLILGIAFVKLGQKPLFTAWDSFNPQTLSNYMLFSLDWNWLDRYINYKSFFQSCKDKFMKISSY